MAGEIIIRKQQELGSLGFAGLPAIISATRRMPPIAPS